MAHFAAAVLALTGTEFCYFLSEASILKRGCGADMDYLFLFFSRPVSPCLSSLLVLHGMDFALQKESFF